MQKPCKETSSRPERVEMQSCVIANEFEVASNVVPNFAEIVMLPVAEVRHTLTVFAVKLFVANVEG